MARLMMLLRMLLIFFAALSVSVNAQDSVDFQGGVDEVVQNEYRLSIGDIVRIDVFGEPDLTMTVQLSELGTFNYPYLGELNIIGKTISEVHQIITKGLEGDFLIDPRINVTVQSYREVFVGGEVRQPGSFPYQPGLTVSKAVFLAGGFTERSSRRRVKVRSEGEKKIKRVALEYALKPGDTVTVSRRYF